jgi:hypothetical protein
VASVLPREGAEVDVNTRKLLAATVLVAMMFVGVSAFADSRHRNRTGRDLHHFRGRVSRIHPWRGGYRVFVGGAPYPFFVPSRFYHPNRFRVGVHLGIGGYYNPLGYYDYYDRYDRYDYHNRLDRADRYDGKRFTRATLRGVVETVDERNGLFTVRNEESEGTITVSLRGRDHWEELQPGDEVEIDGAWTRLGVFDAFDIYFVKKDR